MYADPALDRKPELLGQRGGAFYSEAAVALLASLVGDTGDTQVVNVRNAGTLPFLPDDAVIEVPAVIGADGAAPGASGAGQPADARPGRARDRRTRSWPWTRPCAAACTGSATRCSPTR